MDFHIKLERLSLASLFQPSLMFAGKARALPSEALQVLHPRVGPGLTHKH